MMRPWAGCNGNSERFRSFRALSGAGHGVGAPMGTARGTHLGHGRAVRVGASTNPKGQKIGARPTLRYPMGQKRSLSPAAGPTQYGGITQNLSPSGTRRYCTYRYKLILKMSTFRFNFAVWL